MHAKKTRLGVERLDQRDVPACLVGLGGPGTLSIVGNGASDTVVMNDNGAGTISGFSSGWGGFKFSGIKLIGVQNWAGTDHVVYNFTCNLLSRQPRLVVVW